MKLIKSFTKTTVLILIWYSFYNVHAHDTDTIVPGCDFYGTVVDYSSVDSCGYLILLDSGYVIDPVKIDPDITLYDSMRVKVGFEYLDIATVCQAGKPVAITCFKEIIDTVYCQAKFNYYPLDSDSNEYWYPKNYYHFYDVSLGEVKERKWLVNGSYYSSSPDTLFYLPGPAKYEICLQIETYSGCQSEYCETIVIDTAIDECKAMFRYVQKYPPIDCIDTIVTDSGIFIPDCIPNDSSNYLSNWVQFYDQSIGDIDDWYWEFGDGATSTEQNPLHEFPGPGWYEVCLTIYSESGADSCFDSFCTTVFIDSANYDCKAYFEYCSYNIPGDTLYKNNHGGIKDTMPRGKSLIIGFKNLSSPDHAYYYWNFGDGHYSHEKHPVHKYNVPGIYNVCLEISTETGCHSKYCKEINVGGSECEVEFTYDIAVPDCDGFKVAHVFMAPPTDDISFYSWNFDDGHYSREANPIHIFENYGVYNVCLEVIYWNGCKARSCQKIVIKQEVIDTVFKKKCGASPVKDLEYTGSIGVESIYPQPAKDLVNFIIHSDRNQNVQVSLYNLLGQKFEIASDIYVQEGKNEVPLYLNRLNAGVYLYTVNSQNGTFSGRVTLTK